jgi:dihydroorotase
MDILLRQVHITDPSSPFHKQVADIFIQNGIITDIGQLSVKTEREIRLPGLHVSAGWLDIFSHFCDPGFEFRETLETGSRAAAAGGFTDVMILPNTSPVLHNKSGIEYIVQRSKTLPATIHPIAAITKNTEGKELAEMYDMHNSGAVAFSDGTNTVQSSGLLLKALQYIRAINKTIIQIPDDKSISGPGLMNEGIVSTQLGLPGKPAIAEELMITRDIELAMYTGSRIHITGVTSAKSCELIRQAKKKGIDVTASVNPYHLCFCDEDLVHYDTHLKLDPPLRTSEDREALRAALEDGTIDGVASHHLPHDIDHKIIEFQNAAYGTTALETTFAIVRTCMPHLKIEKLVEIFSIKPRKIFGLPQPVIDKGQSAKVSLFLPDEKWTVNELYSRSRNSAFIGKELTGKPIGIINQDKLFLTEY